MVSDPLQKRLVVSSRHQRHGSYTLTLGEGAPASFVRQDRASPVPKRWPFLLNLLEARLGPDRWSL